LRRRDFIKVIAGGAASACPKRLEVLHETLPAANPIAVLVNPTATMLPVRVPLR
jgi:hypothetical protein